MAGIFRRSALERLSSPERTDSPPRFGAGGAAFVLCALALCALCLGVRLFPAAQDPILLENGIFAVPQGTCAVPAPEDCSVLRIFAAPGARIPAGMPLMEVELADGSRAELASSCSGTVFSIASAGDKEDAGSPLAQISPSGQVCAVFAVEKEKAALLRPGQRAVLPVSDAYFSAKVLSVERVYSPQSAVQRFFPEHSAPTCLVVLMCEETLPGDVQQKSASAHVLAE